MTGNYLYQALDNAKRSVIYRMREVRLYLVPRLHTEKSAVFRSIIHDPFFIGLYTDWSYMNESQWEVDLKPIKNCQTIIKRTNP